MLIFYFLYNFISRNFLFSIFCATIICTSLTNGLIFDCTYSMINLFIAGDDYQCRATVRHSGSGRILDDVTGAHVSSEKTNANVEHLNLWNQDMKFIPLNVDKFFPGIKAISWYNSKLLTISADDLKQFPNLVFLGLWLNNLKTLDGDLFKFNPKLQLIDFDDNQIDNVGENLLSNLKNLTVVDFSHNVCIDAFAFTAEDIPDLVVKLEANCTIPTDTSTVETSIPIVDCTATCTLESFAILPHLTNCTRFWECQNGSSNLRNCPEGQIFDINTWRCGDMATSVCVDCD